MSEATSNTELYNALKAGFDIVFMTDDFLGNVIATGNPTKEDLEHKRKCQLYLKWFKKTFKKQVKK